MQEWRLGSYELIRRLGQGGMAQVYLARDTRLGREVAVKVLDRTLAERPGFRERFLREARVVAALDQPNIVPLFDFGEADVLFLVMPYVSGGSLQDALKRTPMRLSEVVTYGSQMTDALDYAHQRGIVHRDLKPANMLIHADGRLMLTDFGLAKILGPTSTRPIAPRGRPDAGTPEYMAPEQIEGRTEERSDIYALGVVLYLLLTGRLPFSGQSSNVVMEAHLTKTPRPPHTLNPAVTPAMEAVILRALAKRPAERYARASEFGAALLSALIASDAAPAPVDVYAPAARHTTHGPAAGHFPLAGAPYQDGLGSLPALDVRNAPAVPLPIVGATLSELAHAQHGATSLLPLPASADPVASLPRLESRADQFSHASLARPALSPHASTSSLLPHPDEVVAMRAATNSRVAASRSGSGQDDQSVSPAARSSVFGGYSPANSASRASSTGVDLSLTTTTAAPSRSARSTAAPVVEAQRAQQPARAITHDETGGGALAELLSQRVWVLVVIVLLIALVVAVTLLGWFQQQSPTSTPGQSGAALFIGALLRLRGGV